MSNAIDIQSLLNRLRVVSETGCDPDLPHEAADAMEALLRDAESWYEQAQSRTNDAVTFAQERDALAARLAELEGQEPVAAQCRFTDGRDEWRWCDLVHHRYVQAHPSEWAGYETRALFALPTPAEPSATRLLAIATGQLRHTYAGLCPDLVSGPNSRDPECTACRVIAAAESAPQAVRLTTAEIVDAIRQDGAYEDPRAFQLLFTTLEVEARAIETAVLAKNRIEVAE